MKKHASPSPSVARSVAAAFVAFAALTGWTQPAHAEMSDRTRMIVWAIDRFEYMSDCRFDKADAGRPPAYSTCLYQLGQENDRVLTITGSELDDPNVKRVLAIHAKSVAYVARIKAAEEARANREKNALEAHALWKNDVVANNAGLETLDSLEQKKTLHDLEKGIAAALELGPFVTRCSEYAKLPPQKNSFTSEPPLAEEPAKTCSLATRRNEILKKEVPPILAGWRKAAKARQDLSIAAIAKGDSVMETTIACARDAAACGAGEAKKIEAMLGLASSTEASEPPAFKAAMSTATSKKRIGNLHDAAREGAVVRALRNAGIAFIATGIYHTFDDVKKNGLGIPLKRERGVSVLVQVKGESYCRSYMAYAVADYAGGGTYTSFGAQLFDQVGDSFLVSSCR